MPEKASSWPTVIGVISIVVASLGLLCGCTGFFAPQFYKWAADMAAQSGQSDPMLDIQVRVAEQFQIFFIVLTVLSLASSVWLLVVAINLCRRKRSSRGGYIGWSVYALIVMAANLGLQVLMTQSMANALAQEGHGQRVTELWGGASFGLCIGLAFGAALPIFSLIWFSRGKIRNEVFSWR
jgi:hypothetical protein